MSVVLLTAPPWILDDIRRRDPDAMCIPGANAVLGTQDAVMCKQTLTALYSHHQMPATFHTLERSIHDVGDGFRVRIVHDTGIMGPLRFLNIGPGNYTCPWGVWTLYKGSEDAKETLTSDEAARGYRLAQSFTYSYSDRNERTARAFGYLDLGKGGAQ